MDKRVDFDLPFEIQAVYTDGDGREHVYRLNFLWEDVNTVEEFGIPNKYTQYLPESKTVLVLKPIYRQVVALLPYEFSREVWWEYKSWQKTQRVKVNPLSAQ